MTHCDTHIHAHTELGKSVRHFLKDHFSIKENQSMPHHLRSLNNSIYKFNTKLTQPGHNVRIGILDMIWI